MKKIKTFSDACKALKLNPKKLPIVSGLPKKHQKAIIAHYKLVIIAQALNEEWEPNWNDYNELKYYPWFYYDNTKEGTSGFAFSITGYGDSGTNTTVGSRLCFKTRALAEYAGKKFIKLYNEYLLI